MPEFILDHGTREAALQFKALDSFTQGYIEAMFFTSTGTGDDGDLKDASVAELAPDAWQSIIEDCANFQKLFADDLAEACDQDKMDYGMENAGRDFWYTRNYHGAGYWDRGLGDIGDKLTDNVKGYAELYLYRGDDGLIYVE